MKALLIVNPSSGGEKAAGYEELATKNCRNYLMKWLLHTQKKRVMPSGSHLKLSAPWIACLQWEVMVQLMRRSAELLVMRSVRVLAFSSRYSQ